MSESEILIVDDDAAVRDSLRVLLETSGFAVREFDCAKALLHAAAPANGACVIADVRMPDMDGLTLQEELTRRQMGWPMIIITGHGDVPLAVRAMKAGVVDFLEKPIDEGLLLESIGRALSVATQTRTRASWAQVAEKRIGLLTGRERQVLEHLVAGRSNKVIAHELDISPRTVEIHRAHLMEKMQANNLSELIRLALAAGVTPAAGKESPRR